MVRPAVEMMVRVVCWLGPPPLADPADFGTWQLAVVWPLLFLVSTTICFWPLLIPFFGVTVSRMGRSEAPARTERGMLMVCMV